MECCINLILQDGETPAGPQRKESQNLGVGGGGGFKKNLNGNFLSIPLARKGCPYLRRSLACFEKFLGDLSVPSAFQLDQPNILANRKLSWFVSGIER